ncbi:MAG TPA: cupin domain-containing protein [Gaiellaceae bacterium]|nr:cupin domain-containing protein [Gaiellaceae bacterium]
MIQPGDVLANEATGETIAFLEAAEQTDGAYTLIECTVEPGGGVPMAHVHPYQSETFEVISGELSLRAGRDRVVAQAGDVVTVEPGRVHKFWNATAYPVTFRCTVAPALEFERFIETLFALGADGKLNGRGMPSPLRLAAIANAHFADSRAPYVPAWLQKAGLASGALLAKAFGYGPSYERRRPQPELVPATA